MLHVVLKNQGRELAVQGQGPDVNNFLAGIDCPAGPAEAGDRGNGSVKRNRDVGSDQGTTREGAPGAYRWSSGRATGGWPWLQWLEGNVAKLPRIQTPAEAGAWGGQSRAKDRFATTSYGAVPPNTWVPSQRQPYPDLASGEGGPPWSEGGGRSGALTRGRSTEARGPCVVGLSELGNGGGAQRQWAVPPEVCAPAQEMVKDNPRRFMDWVQQVPLPQGWTVGYDLGSQWPTFWGPDGQVHWTMPPWLHIAIPDAAAEEYPPGWQRSSRRCTMQSSVGTNPPSKGAGRL